MDNITKYTLTELKALLDRGDIKSSEIIGALKNAYENDRKHPLPLNGYVEFFNDALPAAEKEDKKRAAKQAGRLSGLPVAVKDNILIKDRLCSCASGVLSGFTAPYSSTVVDRLISEGMIPTGRTNMDEFGMGSSCEYSIYGPSRNPHDRERTPGGSSGGSAAIVASFQAPAALGTETGGSIRLPAAFCGLYGLKPSYGTLSRYGLVAFGSSLDQIGILSRCPDDIALILETTAGRDPHDATSAGTDFKGLFPLSGISLKGLKVSLPEEFFGPGIEPEILTVIEKFIDWLTQEGAEIARLSIPILKSAVAIYYIIAPAEASSNLARYDGVRYGFRKEDAAGLEELYIRSRSAGFGKEVKRRIFIGNYVLSSGYYDAYYKKAMLVRTLLCSKLNDIFSSFDLIISPTSPCSPFKIGEKVDDPLAMYLTDICTTFANLALLPALSIPCGKTTGNLPAGVQIVGRRFSEKLLLQIAKTWEKNGGRR
jgi:aspartyl-tRNA(Asn)/glutamyl-tRNA(Gln) amidotransferase subunit A